MPRQPRRQPYAVRQLCRKTFGDAWWSTEKSQRVAWARAQLSRGAPPPVPPPADVHTAAIEDMERNVFTEDREESVTNLVERLVSMRNADLPSDTSEWEQSEPLTIEQLHKYFRKIAPSIHPDRNPHPRATETFQRLSNIKTSLLDAMQDVEPPTPPERQSW